MNKILIVLSLLLINSAHADLGVLGGLSYYNISSTPDSAVSSKAGITAGLMYTSSLLIGPTLEIDALYNSRKLGLSDGTTNTYPEIQIPVLLRLPIIPFLFNVGAGAYYGFGIGSISNSSGASSSYSAYGMSTSDYGVLASAQATLPIPGIARLVVDARYAFGLANTSANSAITQHTREIQLLTGLVITL